MADETQTGAPADAVAETDDGPTVTADNPDLEASFEDLLGQEMQAIREAKGEEGEDADDDGVQEASAEAEPAGTEEPGAEEAKPKARPPVREERPVKVIQRLEAENVDLRRQLKELREQPRQEAFRPSGDLVEDTIAIARSYLGPDARPDDPRIRGMLERLGRGIVAELTGETTKDPELIRLRAEREQNRRHAEVQRQIDELKAQKAAADAALSRSEGVGFVRTGLAELSAADEFPYLFAAETDVESTVYDGIQMLVDGGYRISDRQSALDAIAYVAKRLDDDARTTAERLTRVGRKSEPAPNQPRQDTTRGAQKDGPQTAGRTGGRGTKTVTASGVVSREAPQRAPEPKSTDDLFEDLLREDRQERRRNAASRTRRN